MKTFRASHPALEPHRSSGDIASRRVRGEGFEPPSPGSKPGGLPLADPRSSECPAGVEPASPAWKAGTSAARPRARKAEGEGVEPSRLIARPLSRRLPSPVGLTFRIKAAVAGIEPASPCSQSTWVCRYPTSRLSRTPSTQMTHGQSAHYQRSGSGGARIRVPSFSGRCAIPSQLPTQQKNKKARCRCDTGLSVFLRNLRPSVTSARDSTKSHSPIEGRMYPSLLRCSKLSRSEVMALSQVTGSPTRAAAEYSIV